MQLDSASDTRVTLCVDVVRGGQASLASHFDCAAGAMGGA